MQGIAQLHHDSVVLLDAGTTRLLGWAKQQDMFPVDLWQAQGLQCLHGMGMVLFQPVGDVVDRHVMIAGIVQKRPGPRNQGRLAFLLPVSPGIPARHDRP